MAIKIALAGNPNSGKTTMFNSLTGSSQRVGNWPGVTVEKKEGTLKKNKDVIIQDLPGIYSLSPYTPEEVVSREYLVGEKPDAIINIVDASNIERNLYLTTQLTEIGVPVVIALNMMDIVKKNKDEINTEKLSKALGCPVVNTTAITGEGAKALAEKALQTAGSGKRSIPVHKFSARVEESIEAIEKIIEAKNNSEVNTRWFAVKLFERDNEAVKSLNLSQYSMIEIEGIIKSCETDLDDDSESIITNERYNYITDIIGAATVLHSRGKLSLSDKIDQIVTNRILALPIFAVVMFLVYFLSISTVGSMMTDWVNETLFGEIIPEGLGGWIERMGTADWLSGLVMEGIVAGVGAVLGFLPQMIVLFLCLAFLEDSGYMARIAFVLDRIFRKFGLSGKSFIPMLISTGCGVPGIMASRTIENENDRRMTIITTTFMPCGAKLPIIALVAGAVFPGSLWVAPVTYFIGIAAIIVSGIMLKKTRHFAGETSPFVMELPAYHMPRPKSVLRTTYDRALSFVKKAGSIVLISSILIWFLSSYSWSLKMVDDAEQSMLASIGGILAPLFAPLGWGDWKAVAASIMGITAKENLVGTLGILMTGLEEIAEDGFEYWANFAAAFTQLSGFSFLVFNLLCAPCFAAIGAVRREMMSAKWTSFAIIYQCTFAYAISFMIFQLGSWIQTGHFGMGTVLALATLAGMVHMLIRKPSGFNKASVKKPQEVMS